MGRQLCLGLLATKCGARWPVFQSDVWLRIIDVSHHYDLLDLVSRYEFFTHNFPSKTYLRERITEQATHDMVYLSHELKKKHVFLSCDKGKSTVLMSW